MSADPGRWQPRRRRGALGLAVAGVAALGLLVVGALRGTLVYYRTPSEVLDDRPPATDRIRLGGTVVPGSLHELDGTGTRLRFRITDGRREVMVEQRGAAPPGTFAAGRDAVVEGVLADDGVFESDTVMVKHSNEYRSAGSPR